MGHLREQGSANVAERGQELYERDILSRLDASAHGKFLVLDVDTGAYEVDGDGLTALQRARARRPGGRFYLVRIGFSAAYRLRSGVLLAPPWAQVG